MNQYWQTEFKQAWTMLCDKLYKADGYNYGKERGIENNTLIEMISLKAEIERVKKLGGLFYEYKSYTIQIYNLLGVGV